MSELRLVAPDEDLAAASDAEEDGPFSTGTPLPRRLPRGRHGIPRNLVAEHQRRRLIAAMAEALAEHGYASVTTTHVSERANVSTSTFYKQFGNLWDCLLAAYVASADCLCAEIEAACAAAEEESDPLRAGIDAALSFFAAEPQLGQLLSAQAPREASALGAARRLLISRLAAMLRRTRGEGEGSSHPPGLDERLIDAALAYAGSRIAAGDAERLPELCPELVAILDRPRCVA
jgi:AcrR family transcriptional regulator